MDITEISCKNGQNVEELFDDILVKIHKKKNPDYVEPVPEEPPSKKPYVPRLNYTAIKEEHARELEKMRRVNAERKRLEDLRKKALGPKAMLTTE